ncbi:glycosyl hydrolase family 28-related protein [Streptacidiphilus rugosus]|uniref:glycosyl hydrolase family 28-related protein n=1 Tax=Streptacidiphilus rugosus TaxID=405783 RepID=UPI00056593BD|nr:glycosyl hydrolase family 28-related protein [Streptacidiphilus rugosus]
MTSRRSLLARTVAGAAGLSALSVALPSTAAEAASTGQGVTDWVNAVTGFGADPTGATDSTAAIQQALNSLAGPGGVVYLPNGSYLCNQARITAVDKVTLQGAGPGTVLRFDGTVNPTLFGMADTTRRHFNLRDLTILQTSGTPVGTAVDATSFVYSDFTRLVIGSSTGAPNVGIDVNGGSAYYNWVNWCQITVGGANAVGVRFANGSNNNHVLGGRVSLSTSDATSTGIYVNAKSCSLQSPNVQDGAGVGIDIGPTGVATTVNDPYLENNAVANMRFASGVLSPTVIGGTIENDTAFTPNIVDNGAITPLVLNARTSHGGDVYAHTKAVVGNTWQAEDHGLTAWAYDPAAISAGSALVSGTAYFVKLPVRYVTTLSKVWFDVATAATTVTAGRNFFGLYVAQPGGATASLVASGSADAALATAGLQSVAITPTVVTPGYVYACVMASGFTGAPALGRNAGGAVGNLNLAASAFRFFQNTTGNSTALPSSITLASNATPPAAFWSAVS